MSVTFVDGTTPLNAANMNTLESKSNKGQPSGYPALDAAGFVIAPAGAKFGGDTQIARITAGAFGLNGGIYIQAVPLGVGFSFNPASFVGSNIAFQSTVSGENARLVVNHGGDMHWGPGGATAADTGLYRAAAGVLKTDGAISTGAYGTTLPASPVDGQEFTLVDSVTNPSYQWRFRYNAGSTSPYKWEYVGGAGAHTDAFSTFTVTSTTYIPLGIGVTVPRAGDYDWRLSTMMYESVGAAGNYLAATAAISSAAASDNQALFYTIPAVNQAVHGSRDGRLTGLSAGAVIDMYARASAGTGNFDRKHLVVTPVRVA